MSDSPIIIIKTGSANLASVLAAFDRLEVPARVSDNPSDIHAAEFVVLPGVGAFGPAMEQLAARGLDVAIKDRFRRNRPLLAICLGLQLLCESSDESPGAIGLSLLPGHIARFDGAHRIPQMGWNTISPRDTTMLQSGYAYFANSYRLATLPPGWSGAFTTYGSTFVSAFERGSILACQFHPELSGTFGLSLIKRWLNSASEAIAC